MTAVVTSDVTSDSTLARGNVSCFVISLELEPPPKNQTIMKRKILCLQSPIIRLSDADVSREGNPWPKDTIATSSYRGNH